MTNEAGEIAAADILDRQWPGAAAVIFDCQRSAHPNVP